MSLLTTEQRIIFDETIRLRHVDALNDGEEGLTVTHGHKGKLLPGNRSERCERNTHPSAGARALAGRTRGDPRPYTHPAHPRDDDISRRRDAATSSSCHRRDASALVRRVSLRRLVLAPASLVR